VLGLGGIRRTGYGAELFDDASLVEDDRSAVFPCCAKWLTMVY
jgi:hypothetical protein